MDWSMDQSLRGESENIYRVSYDSRIESLRAIEGHRIYICDMIWACDTEIRSPVGREEYIYMECEFLILRSGAQRKRGNQGEEGSSYTGVDLRNVNDNLINFGGRSTQGSSIYAGLVSIVKHLPRCPYNSVEFQATSKIQESTRIYQPKYVQMERSDGKEGG